MKIGDTIVEWSYIGCGGKDKHFISHTIKKITPTGRIKTDTGIELSEHLKIRGKNRRSYQSFFSPFNDEIKQEIKLQRMKDSIKENLNSLDVHTLNNNELEQFYHLLNSIKNRQNTDLDVSWSDFFTYSNIISVIKGGTIKWIIVKEWA